MIDNKVRYEIDGSGAFIGQTMGSVRALTDYTTTIELVSPLPLDTSVMVNFLVYDSRNIDLPLFMIPNGKKGYEVSDNPLVADWNVWEVGIDQTALAAISKYRAGRIGVSFTFRERRPSNNALNYKGIFDGFNPLPLVGENDGDYYVCRGYNILVSGTLYTYNDNAVWQTDKWVRDRNMRITLTTTTIDLPVDPALLANVPDVPAQDIADIIAQWGAIIVKAVQSVTIKGSDTIDGETTVVGSNVELELDVKLQSSDNLIEASPSGIKVSETLIDGKIDNKISEHNESEITHEDIRLELRDKLEKDFNGYVERENATLNDLIVVRFGGNTYKTPLSKVIALVSNISGIPSLVFDNNNQLTSWLNGTFIRPDGITKEDLRIGQSIFTISLNDDDYWVSELPVNAISDLTPYSGGVDLSNFYNKDNVDELLSFKVNKEIGKGLTSNDFTTVLLNKLNGIETGAQVNKQPDEETITLNNDDELEATNVAIWRYS